MVVEDGTHSDDDDGCDAVGQQQQGRNDDGDDGPAVGIHCPPLVDNYGQIGSDDGAMRGRHSMARDGQPVRHVCSAEGAIWVTFG